MSLTRFPMQSHMDNASVTVAEITPRSPTGHSAIGSAVDAGFITWDQATLWYQR